MLVRKTPTHGEAAQQKRTLPRFPKQQCDLGRHANLPVMGGSSSNSRKGDLRLRPCRKKGTEKAKSEAKFGDKTQGTIPGKTFLEQKAVCQSG